MKMVEPWSGRGQWRWSTMAWKYFDNGWIIVDHGQVKWPPLSGNHGLTMVNHGQATIVNHGQTTMVTVVSSTIKNKMTMVNHGQHLISRHSKQHA